MKAFFIGTVLSVLLHSSAVFAMGDDDPILSKWIIDKLESRNSTDSDVATALVWDLEGWIGKDLDKLWFKAEGEKSMGTTEHAELELRYSHAVSPYWDWQIGWRSDLASSPERNGLVLGFRGQAPYFIELDASLFISSKGRSAFRLHAEHELMISQRLLLIPELEINAYAEDNQETKRGSGLSDTTLGLRLAYEIHRKFAPYIGISRIKKFGDTADFSRAEGEETRDIHYVFGFKAWF